MGIPVHVRQLWLLLLAAAAGGVSCGGDGTPSEPGSPSISLSPAAFTLVVGESRQLSATVRDASGTPLPSASVTWRSLDPSVAEVDDDGLVTALAPGSVTIRAVSEGTSAEATGSVSYDLSAQPQSLTAGAQHACGLSGSSAYCWGDNRYGQLGDGSITTAGEPVSVSTALELVQVASGPMAEHTCGLTTTNQVVCWGNDEDGQVDGTPSAQPITVPTPVDLGGPATQVSVGGRTSCAILAAGPTVCWGDNAFGELGRGSVGGTSEPLAVATPEAFVSIDVGRYSSCGITGDGAVYCWGFNQYGGVGAHDYVEQPTPLLLSETLLFDQVSVGDGFACGVSRDRMAYCWGSDASGKLGSPSPDVPGTPVEVPVVGVSEVHAGGHFACALRDPNEAVCWGRNFSGEVGSGSFEPSEGVPPTVVAGGIGFAGLALGNAFACGLDHDGSTHCWGSNGRGQIGDGLPPIRFDAVEVSGGHRFMELDAGGQYTCGIDELEAVWCWGAQYPAAVTSEPVVVDADVAYGQLSVGDSHTCALTVGGVARCWGRDRFGALGNGPLGDSESPGDVVSDSSYVTIASGVEFSCASTGSGYTDCWGLGQQAQHGNGSFEDSQTPVAGAVGVAPVQLVAGSTYGCARDGGGTVTCWGRTNSLPTELDEPLTLSAIFTGFEDACGVEETRSLWCWNTRTLYPTAVDLSDGSAESAAASPVHTCAATVSGRVYCWGANDLGQLGIVNIRGTLTPTATDFAPSLSALAAGRNHTCGLDAEGRAFCWGLNASGQLGVPVTASTSVPLAVLPY